MTSLSKQKLAEPERPFWFWRSNVSGCPWGNQPPPEPQGVPPPPPAQEIPAAPRSISNVVRHLFILILWVLKFNFLSPLPWLKKFQTKLLFHSLFRQNSSKFSFWTFSLPCRTMVMMHLASLFLDLIDLYMCRLLCLLPRHQPWLWHRCLPQLFLSIQSLVLHRLLRLHWISSFNQSIVLLTLDFRKRHWLQTFIWSRMNVQLPIQPASSDDFFSQ